MSTQIRLGRAFARLFAGGVLGKALGILREIALAASFGTGASAAAFRAAQTATILPTHFFSSDALNAAFIPLFARYLRESEPRARSLFWSVFLLLAGTSFILAAALWLGAPWIAAALVPGFSAGARAITADMLRIMALGVPFYVQASLASYAEMAHGRYFIASVRASVQNIGLLIGVGAAVLTRNALLLAWGFTLYSVLIATVATLSLVRNGFVGRPARLDGAEAGIVLREFARLIAPLLLLPLLVQAALAVERVVASRIAMDAVAAIDYAKTISETGLALIAVPLGMAGLAELGRASENAARARLEQLLPILLAVTVPCSAFLVANAEGVVRLVFARGQFGETSIGVTTLVLRGLAVGFWAHVTGYVLAKSLSARSRNRQVARAMALASMAHMGVNLLAWPYLGPLTLGLSGSAFGLVLFAASARALDLAAATRQALLPLLGASAAYLPLAWTLRATSLTGLLGAALLFLLFWGLFAGISPAARAFALRYVRRPAWSRSP